MKRSKLCFGAAGALLLGAAYCSLVAYDLVFDEEWSRRPGAFTVSGGYFEIHQNRHSHAAHVRFLCELDAFAKGPGANNQKVMDANNFLQWKHRLKEQVRLPGLVHAYGAAGLLSLSLGFASCALRRREPRASPINTGEGELAPQSQLQPAEVLAKPQGASTNPKPQPASPAMFRCWTCGTEWPENYCPECAATIDQDGLIRPEIAVESPLTVGPELSAAATGSSAPSGAAALAVSTPALPIVRVSKARYVGTFATVGMLLILITFAFKAGALELGVIIGFLCFVFALAIFLIVVMARLWYKAWSAIQDGHARATPAQAVGFSFIPLFNLYWIFQMTWGFARDFNAFAARHRLGIPRLPEGFYLLFAIYTCLNVVLSRLPDLGVLSSILQFAFMLALVNSLCDAINNAAMALCLAQFQIPHQPLSTAGAVRSDQESTAPLFSPGAILPSIPTPRLWLASTITLLVCVATFLLYDGALYWLPKPLSGDIHSADFKEIGIGAGMFFAGLLLWRFARGTRTRVSGAQGNSWIVKVLACAVLGTLAASAALRLEVRRSHWFTHNEVVFLVNNDGERQGTGRLVRHRLVRFTGKTDSSLAVRIVKQSWVGMPAGTLVETADGNKVPVQSDLAGLKLTLELHNVTSVAAWLQKPPYIAGKRRPILKRLSLPAKGFDAKSFPAEGIRFEPGETKLVEFESSLIELEKLLFGEPMYLSHGDFTWNEPLQPLPERSILYSTPNARR